MEIFVSHRASRQCAWINRISSLSRFKTITLPYPPCGRLTNRPFLPALFVLRPSGNAIAIWKSLPQRRFLHSTFSRWSWETAVRITKFTPLVGGFRLGNPPAKPPHRPVYRFKVRSRIGKSVHLPGGEDELPSHASK